MKKGIFLRGSLMGYLKGQRKNPSRKINGQAFKSMDDLTVQVWHSTYEFKTDGTVIVTPHDQLDNA